MIWDWIVRQFAENDIFAGVVGGGVVMSFLYALRSVPLQAWTAFKLRFSCTVVLFSEDEAFRWVEEWLGSLKYALRARRLRLTVRTGNDSEEHWILSPGLGNHVFFHRGRLVWIVRKQAETNQRRRETLEITVFSSHQSRLRELLRGAESLSRQEDTLAVYAFMGYWQKFDVRAHRKLESVFLSPEITGSLTRDLDRFLGAQESYLERGIPWRRAYLLSGPPGCGKTSLVLALASYLKRSIFVLNMGSVHGDTALIEAVADTPASGFLLIEDIDVAGPTREKSEGDGAKDDSKTITLSALLNVLDGAFSKEGRILFMTTNRPEALDAALKRPGRIDVWKEIPFMGEREISSMFSRFFPRDPDLARGLLTQRLRAPGAEVQNLLLHHDSPQKAASAIVEKFGRSRLSADSLMDRKDPK